MKQDASAENTNQTLAGTREAAVRARIIDRGVTTRDQLTGLTGLQQMQLLLDGNRQSRCRHSETLDFALIEAGTWSRDLQGKPSPRLLNPMGTVHGGWYATLLDSAVGCARHTAMPIGRAYTTLELKLNIVKGISLKVPLVRQRATPCTLGGKPPPPRAPAWRRRHAVRARIDDAVWCSKCRRRSLTVYQASFRDTRLQTLHRRCASAGCRRRSAPRHRASATKCSSSCR